MNRLVLLIAVIVLLPVMMFAGYFGWKLIWPGTGGQAAANAGTVPAEASRVYITPPDSTPPEPIGPVLRPDRVEGEVVTQPLVDPSATRRYRVRAGDTLFDIAVAQYGDSTYVQDILARNPGLRPSALQVGEEIILPNTRGEGSGDAEPERPKVYVVRQGDTLIGIARQLYADSAMYLEIFESNRHLLRSPDAVLREGMRLRLPPPPKYD